MATENNVRNKMVIVSSGDLTDHKKDTAASVVTLSRESLSPLVFVAASAIFWKVSRKEPRAKIVFLQLISVGNKIHKTHKEI